MVLGRQMGAQLVGPSCPRAEPETCAALHQLQTTPQRDALLSFWMKAIGGRLSLQTSQRETDLPAETRQLSLHLSDVELSDPSRCEQAREAAQHSQILRQKDES